MDQVRPVVDHIVFVGPPDHQWITRGSLPFYDGVLKWAEDVQCPHTCRLASYCHPMVQDETDVDCHHKLCTLTAIKAGIVTEREITGEKEKRHG